MNADSVNVTRNETRLSLAEQIITGLVLSPIVVGAILGNLLVISSVGYYRKLQTFTNMLLVSLATSDFLVGILVMPFALVYLVQGRWSFGGTYCHIWATFDVLLCTASILNLCAISIDRYCAIQWPLRYIRNRTDYLAAGVVVTVWGLSVIICAPPWFNIPGWSFVPDSQHCSYVKTLSYRIYSACGSFFIPLTIMLTVYSRILKVSTSREKALNLGNRSGSRFFKMHRGRPKTSSALLALDTTAMAISGFRGSATDARGSRTIERSDISVTRDNSFVSYAETDCDAMMASETSNNQRNSVVRDSEPGMKTVGFLAYTARAYYERSMPTALLRKANEYYENSRPVKPSKEKSVYLKERKALKTIGLVVAGFVICWFPFFVLYIFESACVKCGLPPAVGNFFLWLGYSNSVLNPLIYAAYHRDFRRCFRDLLSGGLCKKKTRKTMSVRRLHQSHM